MKKLFIGLAMVIFLLTATAGPVLAWGEGDAIAEVNSEVLEDPGAQTQMTGTTVTASGIVTITSEAYSNALFSYADAYAAAGFEVIDPNGTTVANDSVASYDADLFFAHADASLTFPWTATIALDKEGEYTVAIEGEAFSQYLSFWGYGNAYDYLLHVLSIKSIAGGAVGAEHDGRFLVIINSWNQRQDYPWAELWPHGRTLKTGVDQVGRVDYNSTHKFYRIVIPAGTVITGGNDTPISFIKYYVLSGQMVFEPGYVEFSDICTLYKADSNKWVKVADFNRIVDGQPILN